MSTENKICKMELEQADHFMRHIKMHADELRKGEFQKDVDYVGRLLLAQKVFLTMYNDILHVMRQKDQPMDINPLQFTDLKNLVLDNWREHHFGTFDSSSFSVGRKAYQCLEYNIMPDKAIPMTLEEATQGINILENILKDSQILYLMLKEHFNM